jgi:hypothetical protein
MRFRTVLELGGKTATGIRVPAEVVEALGKGKRPAVRVTINGHTYRNTVAVMGGAYMVGVSAENRVAAGDEVDVDIELDTKPREVAVPPDFAAALDRDPEARRFFGGLSPSRKQWHVAAVEGAKSAETRQRADREVGRHVPRRPRPVNGAGSPTACSP